MSKNNKVNLPSGLSEYQKAAYPVLELVKACYTVTKSSKSTQNIAVWNLKDKEGHKGKLYLTSGFDWTIEPDKEEESDYFPDDFDSWLSDNCIDLEELYNGDEGDSPEIFESENRPTSVRLWRLEQCLDKALERIAKLEKENTSLKTRLDYLQGGQDEQAVRQLNQFVDY